MSRKPANVPMCISDDEPMAYMDSWFPFTELDSMEKTDYDVLIVGTGAGGSAVLWRLCERWRSSGRRIGVVEAGDPLLPTHLRNIPTFNVDNVNNLWQNPKYLQRIRESVPVNGAQPMPLDFHTVKVLGGRTLHWGAASPRMHQVDIAQWPVPLQEMEDYYAISERVMRVNRFFAEGSTLQETMLRRLRNNRFPDAVDLPRAVDLQQTRYGRIHSSAFCSSFDVLARAWNLCPFDLAVQARVVRVLIEQGRVTGLEVMSPDKKSYVLKAKSVVFFRRVLWRHRVFCFTGELEAKPSAGILWLTPGSKQAESLREAIFRKFWVFLTFGCPARRSAPINYRLFVWDCINIKRSL